MVEFQLLLVPIGLILGLGMTRIMTGAITAVRNREYVKLHWLPFIWAASFMIMLLIFFFVLWDLKERFESVGINWTWSYYGPQVLHSILVFLGAGLILQASRDANTDCLLKNFNKHGRLALIPLMSMHFLAWPMNMYMSDVPLFDKANYLNLVMICVIILGFKATRLTWQAAAATIYLLILICAMLTTWSRPGRSWEEEIYTSDLIEIESQLNSQRKQALLITKGADLNTKSKKLAQTPLDKANQEDEQKLPTSSAKRRQDGWELKAEGK